MKSKDLECEICRSLVPYNKPLDSTNRLCDECYARTYINTQNKKQSPCRALETPMSRKYACCDYQESHDRNWPLKKQADWNERSKESLDRILKRHS